MTTASPIHALLFPHEHTNMLSAMHDSNVRSKTRPRLRTFLASSSTLINEQALGVDRFELPSIRPSDDLVELADRHGRGARYQMVLLATIQIGQLLVYVKKFSREEFVD